MVKNHDGFVAMLLGSTVETSLLILFCWRGEAFAKHGVDLINRHADSYRTNAVEPHNPASAGMQKTREKDKMQQCSRAALYTEERVSSSIADDN